MRQGLTYSVDGLDGPNNYYVCILQLEVIIANAIRWHQYSAGAYTCTNILVRQHDYAIMMSLDMR